MINQICDEDDFVIKRISSLYSGILTEEERSEFIVLSTLSLIVLMISLCLYNIKTKQIYTGEFSYPFHQTTLLLVVLL